MATVSAPRKQKKARIKKVHVAIRQVRISEIVKHRISGMAEADIGERVGISQPRVSRMLAEYFQKLHDETMTNLDVIRQIELSRLNALLITHWRLKQNVGNAKVVLQINERISSLLGLDAAKKLDVNNNATIMGAQIDLSKLNDEELMWFERILAKAGPMADDSIVATQEKSA